MATIVRVCDSNCNKYSGFELANYDNIRKLFPNGVRIGTKFKIGEYGYKVTGVYVDGFFTQSDGRGEPVIDNPELPLNTHIWVCCETEDPRIVESQVDFEGIASDLGLT